jgi:hypothetical protein
MRLDVFLNGAPPGRLGAAGYLVRCVETGEAVHVTGLPMFYDVWEARAIPSSKASHASSLALRLQGIKR